MFITSLGNFIRWLLRCSFQLQSNIQNIMLQLMTVHAMKQVTTISQYLLMDVKALLNVPPSFQRRHKTVQKVYCSMLLSAVVITLIWWAARLIVRELQHHYQQRQYQRVCVFMILVMLYRELWQCSVFRFDLVPFYNDFDCRYFGSTFVGWQQKFIYYDVFVCGIQMNTCFSLAGIQYKAWYEWNKQYSSSN